MRARSQPAQPDLFHVPPDPEAPRYRFQDPDPQEEAEWLERVRSELAGTLALLRSSEVWPWKWNVEVIYAQKRFHSMSGWLPTREAEALCAAFDVEYRRVWATSYAQYVAETGDTSGDEFADE